MRITFLFTLLFTLTLSATSQNTNYLNQPSPGKTPEKFAPGTISLPFEYEFGSVFNKAVTEFYYGVTINGKSEIRFSKKEGVQWSKPVTILESKEYGYNDPFLSPDEDRLYFITQQKLGGSDVGDHDILYVEREGKGWSQPKDPGPSINTSSEEYYISFTNNGTMYFSSNVLAKDERNRNFDIYYSEFVNGEFRKAVKLGPAINSESYEADVFIDPNEKYMIFCATRKDGYGQGDLYISFKRKDGTWGASKNMGELINDPGHQLCPFVTSDGKYFFYTSNQDIYWVSTDIFDKYK